MENHLLLDTSSSPYHIPSYDLSGSASGFCAEDWQHVLPAEQSYFDGIPLFESFHHDPWYASLSIEPSPSKLKQDAEDVRLSGGNNDVALWNEINFSGFIDRQNLYVDYKEEGMEMLPVKESDSKNKRCWDERTSSAKMLSKKTISQYFYMPIRQAAKELNVGLTLLKKRCRQLGIRRWPHRKLTSLQTLIRNVQKMTNEDNNKLRNAIEILEREKKLLEELPDLQLEDHTKRLRQACFKVNYKKKRLVAMAQTESKSPCSSTKSVATTSMVGYETIHEIEDDVDEETKCLLHTYLSESLGGL